MAKAFRQLPGMVGKLRIGWWIDHPKLNGLMAMIVATEGENHETLVVFNRTKGWQKVSADKAKRHVITPAMFIAMMKSLPESQIGKDRYNKIKKAVLPVDEDESLQKVCARIGEAVIHSADYSKLLFLPDKKVKATEPEPEGKDEKAPEAPKTPEQPTA